MTRAAIRPAIPGEAEARLGAHVASVAADLLGIADGLVIKWFEDLAPESVDAEVARRRFARVVGAPIVGPDDDPITVPALANGVACRDDALATPPAIRVRVGLSPGRLVEVVGHEAMHVRQYRDLDGSIRAEAEGVCERFAVRFGERLRAWVCSGKDREAGRLLKAYAAEHFGGGGEDGEA